MLVIKYVSLWLALLFAVNVHAETSEAPTPHYDFRFPVDDTPPTEQPSFKFNKTDTAEIARGLSQCASSLGQGVKDNTIGLVVGDTSLWNQGKSMVKWVGKNYVAVQNAGFCMSYPLICAAKGAQMAQSGNETFAKLANTISTQVKSFGSALANVPSNIIQSFVIDAACSTIGMLGVDAVMAALSGGAGAPKILLTINSIVRSRIPKLLNLLSISQKLAKIGSKLGGLSEEALQTVNRLLALHKSEVVDKLIAELGTCPLGAAR